MVEEVRNLFRSKIEILRVIELGGLLFYLVKVNKGKVSIVVKCPRCGRFGTLRSRGFRKVSGKRLYVVCHKDGRCDFGACSDEHEALDAVWHLKKREYIFDSPSAWRRFYGLR